MAYQQIRQLSSGLQLCLKCHVRKMSLKASQKAFPILEAPLNVSNVEKAREKSHIAEQEHLNHVFACQNGGGEKGIARHVSLNKKVLVRDRLRAIMDEDAEFFELSTTAGLSLEYGDVPCGGSITGIGRVHGIDIMFVASDATVKGGTSYPITVTKSLRAQEIAAQNRIPCLYLVDSGGAFLPLQAEIFPDVKHGGRSFRNQAVMSSEGIAQLALVAGLCTAGAAYTPTMSDQAIMVTKIGNIYLGGPPLVKAALGEFVSGEELGGAKLHCSVSGVADYFASSEDESFQMARDCVQSLNLKAADLLNLSFDAPIFDESELDVFGGLEKLDRNAILSIIARITDGSRFFEFKRMFGENLTCGFAHIDQKMVGIIADHGRLGANDSQKGAHFVQICDLRGIPLIFLQNSSNSTPFDDDYTVIKERAKYIHCQATCRVPKVAVNIGGVSGDTLYAMCGPSFGARFFFTWPRASMTKTDPFALKLAQIEAEKAKMAAEKMKESLPSDKPKRKPMLPQSEYKITPFSAQFHASRCTNDGIILPRETRKVLARALQITMMNETHDFKRKGQLDSVIRM